MTDLPFKTLAETWNTFAECFGPNTTTSEGAHHMVSFHAGAMSISRLIVDRIRHGDTAGVMRLSEEAMIFAVLLDVTPEDNLRHAGDRDRLDEIEMARRIAAVTGAKVHVGPDLPAAVAALVVAARGVAYADPPEREALKALDVALEAFASRVAWEDQPDGAEPLEGKL